MEISTLQKVLLSALKLILLFWSILKFRRSLSLMLDPAWMKITDNAENTGLISK